MIETARLLLRRFEAADAPAYAAIRYHPDVDRWLMPAPTDDVVAEQRLRIAEYDASFAARGYGVFAVVERESRALIGHCGLRWLEEFAAADTVWTLAPAVQGRGYAGEAAAAVLQFGFEQIGLPLIGALIRPDNLRSQAVARGLGMCFRRTMLRRPGQYRGWWDIERVAFRRRQPGLAA